MHQQNNPEELFRRLIREEVLQLLLQGSNQEKGSNHDRGEASGGMAMPQPEHPPMNAQPFAALQAALAAQQASYAAQQAILSPQNSQQHNGQYPQQKESSGSSGANGSSDQSSSSVSQDALEKRLRANLQQLRRVLAETEEIGNKLQQMLAQFPSKKNDQKSKSSKS